MKASCRGGAGAALLLSSLVASPAFAKPTLEAHGGENWAVVVSGSGGFANYRHQADVCHAYHILRRNGLSEERIILMSIDDAAHNEFNPVPGTLFNKPTKQGIPGYNVYEGCEENIDYRGDDVTAENFLAVLRGDEETTEGKPVLRSGPDDRVFIYFADHGAPGLIAMPSGSPVYAQDLLEALEYMEEEATYRDLVFYLEACESGSMFEGLLPNTTHVFATTAANPSESSFGTYCGADATVDGVDIGSCLGDLYSVSWMEDADQPDRFHFESLEQQFEYLVSTTSMSHVQRYGDLSLGPSPIAVFLGEKDFPGFASETNTVTYNTPAAAAAAAPRSGEMWDSRDIALHTYRHNFDTAETAVLKQRWGALLEGEKAHREAQDEVFSTLLARAAEATQQLGRDRGRGGGGGGGGGSAVEMDFTSPVTLTRERLSCHKAVNQAVIDLCGPYSDYSLKYVRGLAHLCEREREGGAEVELTDGDEVRERLVREIAAVCSTSRLEME